MRGLTWGHALLGGLVFLSRTVQSTQQDEATPVP